jgi:hypothetical protein
VDLERMPGEPAGRQCRRECFMDLALGPLGVGWEGGTGVKGWGRLRLIGQL